MIQRNKGFGVSGEEIRSRAEVGVLWKGHGVVKGGGGGKMGAALQVIRDKTDVYGI